MTQALPPELRHVGGRWKPYPEYRNSGVEWLGEIPAHWEVQRLRFACRIQPSKSEVSQLPLHTDVSFLPMERIGEDGSISLEETRKLGDVRDGYTYFRDGDVLVAKITPCFENGKGALVQGLVNGVGFGTTELFVLRPSEVLEARFLAYVTRTDLFRSTGTALMHGAAGQQRVPDDFIRNFPLPLPPPPEQRAIAAFLDRETAKMDALIAKRERLIALLEEKRAALISHAVTRGLGPNVPMKDSGVEWLGEIPAHWSTIKARDIAESLQTGPFGSQLHADDYLPGGIPVINPAHLQGGRIVPDWECAVDEETRQRLIRHELRAGDIIFARRGDIGRCALVTENEDGWICGTGSLRLRPKAGLCEPEFLVYALSTGGVRHWLLTEAVGSTMDNLSTSIIARVPSALPPLAEQQAIVMYLRRELVRIDALAGKVRAQVEKLQEHRTALISAAVTGKIDVQDEVT